MIELRNRFSCLADEEINNSDDVEKDWEMIKKTYHDTDKEKGMALDVLKSTNGVPLNKQDGIQKRQE